MERGGLGEPYCSKECWEQGGRYAFSVQVKNESDPCGFCQKQVQMSAFGVGVLSGGAAIPYEGMTLFVCDGCASKAETHLLAYRKCCMCQKAL
jgi:hypothetical protein